MNNYPKNDVRGRWVDTEIKLLSSVFVPVMDTELLIASVLVVHFYWMKDGTYYFRLSHPMEEERRAPLRPPSEGALTSFMRHMGEETGMYAMQAGAVAVMKTVGMPNFDFKTFFATFGEQWTKPLERAIQKCRRIPPRTGGIQIHIPQVVEVKRVRRKRE